VIDLGVPGSATRRKSADWRELLSRSRVADWWPLPLFTCLGLVAVIAGAWLADLTEDKWFDALWLEVAKAGVQVVAVGVLGGALAATWQTITSRREAEIERDAKERERELESNDKIRDELVSLVALYNGVKAVRRVLRSLGLDLKTYPVADQETVRRTALLTDAQARGFH
jgi:uncharacterized membrane protein YcjF (UPF0283 family)